MTNHALTKIESNIDSGYHAPECAIPVETYWAVCECGWESEQHTIRDHADYDHAEHSAAASGNPLIVDIFDTPREAITGGPR
jgi:hypothetical protein